MPEANMFSEKRIHPRVLVKIPVKYRVIEDAVEVKTILEHRKKDHDAQTVDMSLGGLYIVSDQALATGKILRLDISLADNKRPVIAFAEVVWANETGGGLRFLTIKDEDMSSLKAYLDKVSS